MICTKKCMYDDSFSGCITHLFSNAMSLWIEDCGVDSKTLARVLKSFKGMIMLNLERCVEFDDGLSEAISACPTIEFLCLTKTKASGTSISKIRNSGVNVTVIP